MDEDRVTGAVEQSAIFLLTLMQFPGAGFQQIVHTQEGALPSDPGAEFDNVVQREGFFQVGDRPPFQKHIRRFKRVN